MAKTPRWRRGHQPPAGTDEAGGASVHADAHATAATPASALTEPAPEPGGPAVEVAETPGAAEPDPTRTLVADQLPAPEDVPLASGEREPAFSLGSSLGNLTPLLLLRAAHPRQALLTAIGVTAAALVAGRPSRELLLILVTVVVGQAVLGWANDLVDRRRDARHETPGKPVADGRLDPGTVWFSLAIGIFLVVPLSVGSGLYAGTAYLVSLAIGLLGQWPWLRRGFLSWVPWAAAYALYPAFLSYGGWGGQERGAPPELVMTVLAAALGVGVHLLTALWGLVADNEDRWTYLPLKLGLRLGASRLLWVAGGYTLLVLLALAYAGSQVGLSQQPL